MKCRGYGKTPKNKRQRRINSDNQRATWLLLDFLTNYFEKIANGSWLSNRFNTTFSKAGLHQEQGWQVPSRGPPVRHSLQMSTKLVTTTATTAIRVGCVRHGVGHKTPFSGAGRGSRNAAEHPRPNIQFGLIRMSLVSRGLTDVIITLWRKFINNGDVIMRTSYSLLRNEHHRATIVPARMKANGNFSDASVERFYSVRINRMMSPSDAVDLGRPCNSLFKFQVVHRYVSIMV